MSLVKPMPGEVAEAKRHPNGWVYRIAGRFNSNERIPPEAIVGAWRVNELGEIEGEFLCNHNYDPSKWPGAARS